MPVTPATLVNSRACSGRSARRSRRARAALRAARPSTARAATRRILSSSFIRLTRVCRRPAVSTRIGSRPLRLPRLDRVEHHGRRIGAFARADDVDAGALRPDLELLDGRGAKRVGGARRAAACPTLQQFASLPTVVVLPVPLTPTISMTCGVAVRSRRLRHRREDRADLVLDQSRRLSPSPVCCLDGGDDPLGRGDADVGRDQQLLERLDRVDVDRPSLRARRVRPAGRSRRTARRSAAWFWTALREGDRKIPFDLRRLPVRPLRPQHQLLDAPRRRCGAGEHLRHLRGDRQLDAVRAPSASAASVVRTPSATIFMPARTSASGRPRASSTPT